MFRKRVKKDYPPGTFIPMPARVCAIIQLSLAFMIILWNVSQPFMGELFTYKSQMLIYQDVMGLSKSSDPIEKRERLERNNERFESFPNIEKTQLTQHYEQLQQLSQRTILQKLWRSIRIIVLEVPFYEQLWLALSLILPILILKRVEGAAQAVWLLPLLTCIYSLDNHRYGQHLTPSAETRLFPSEQILINDYLQQPLSPLLLEQKTQLLSAWKLYLIKEWSPRLSLDKSINNSDQLAEHGEFAFNVARINSLPHPKEIIKGKRRAHKESLIILSLYLFWNFFFAATVFRLNFRQFVIPPV